MRGTRLQTSPLFWLAELQANGHTQLSIPALGWEDKNISLLKYSTHGLSMAANQTPAQSPFIKGKHSQTQTNPISAHERMNYQKLAVKHGHMVTWECFCLYR